MTTLLTPDAPAADRLLLATREILAFVDEAGWVPGPTLIHFRRCIEPAALDRLAERSPRLWTRVRQAAAPLRFTLREGMELLAAAAHLDLELVPEFDARADTIWAEARGHYPVIADRSWAALRRRYDRDPHRQLHRVYLLAHGRPVGYFVQTSRFVRGVDTTTVLDFLASPRWLPGLLVACVLYAHETNAGLLELATNDGMAAYWLRALGFKGTQIQALQAHLPAGLGDPRSLPPPDTWFLSAADVLTLEDVDVLGALRAAAPQDHLHIVSQAEEGEA
ncbi:MAG: hypothetical protein H6730_03110 [Deltaproteobacteria bacterium]|nr:hypothetical protein [Deltaproteobacteria bacterium]